MPLHPPKHISSTKGLGLNTTKTMRHVTRDVSIGTEIWHDMREPWREGETIIAQPGYVWTTRWEVGKPYIITKFHDADAHLIGVYCDVTRPVAAIDGGFACVDLYLDVWQIAGQDPVILDEDELTAAVQAGFVQQEEAAIARGIANDVLIKLKTDAGFVQF